MFIAYPIHFTPVYKSYVWGGRRISEKYRRGEEDKLIAESWEVSDHPDGMSFVDNGPHQGKSLQQLIHLFKEEMIGEEADFPLLIKILDAHQNLSLQVHPDEVTAKMLGGEAKSECWYVLEASPKASVIAGFKENIGKERFLDGLKEGRVLDLTRRIPVQAGDTIDVPAGTIHAVLEGTLLLEVQQKSNTTYRIDDWGRKRELHLKQATASLHFKTQRKLKHRGKVVENKRGLSHRELLKTPHFRIGKLQMQRELIIAAFGKFQILFGLKGHAIVKVGRYREVLNPGKTLFIPAKAERLEIKPLNAFEMIRVTR